MLTVTRCGFGVGVSSFGFRLSHAGVLVETLVEFMLGSFLPTLNSALPPLPFGADLSLLFDECLNHDRHAVRLAEKIGREEKEEKSRPDRSCLSLILESGRTEVCRGSETGSCLRLIDFCITQL